MKAASAALINLLNSGNEFFMADLLTITLVGGTILYYTSADAPITVGNLIELADAGFYDNMR